MPMLWLIPASMTSRMRRYSREMEIFFSSVFSSRSLTEKQWTKTPYYGVHRFWFSVWILLVHMAWQPPPAGDEEPLQNQHLQKRTCMTPAKLYMIIWNMQSYIWLWNLTISLQLACESQPHILLIKKSPDGDTLGPVELIVWPEQGNQGDWREQDG